MSCERQSARNRRIVVKVRSINVRSSGKETDGTDGNCFWLRTVMISLNLKDLQVNASLNSVGVGKFASIKQMKQ